MPIRRFGIDFYDVERIVVRIIAITGLDVLQEVRSPYGLSNSLSTLRASRSAFVPPPGLLWDLLPCHYASVAPGSSGPEDAMKPVYLKIIILLEQNALFFPNDHEIRPCPSLGFVDMIQHKADALDYDGNQR